MDEQASSFQPGETDIGAGKKKARFRRAFFQEISF
jgi:hypothetical protein